MRVDVLGVPVDALDLDRATDEVAGWISTRRRGYVCVTGVHGVLESRRSPAVRAAHLAADLVVPDGMPLVWCARRAGAGAGRVYGPDLMLAVLARGVSEGWRHALYGSSPDVLADLQDRLEARFPGVQIVAAIAPPFRPVADDEGQRHVAEINATSPDVVWVGLSTPKQELWMHRWHGALTAGAVLGVGAAFSFHAGHLAQAPPILQRNGLEWAYRLAREPRRLWRRYLRNNPAFVAGIVRHPPRLLVGAPAPGAGRSGPAALTARRPRS